MPDNRHNPWYYLLPLTAGVIGGSILAWLFNAGPILGGAVGAALLIVLFLVFGGPAKPKGNAYSLALPLLFLVNFHLSGWWLLALLVVAVWGWALSRKSQGDYDFGPGFALVGALIFTVAVVIGAGAGWLLG